MTSTPRTVDSALDEILDQLVAAYTEEKSVRVYLEPGQTAIQDWCMGSCGSVYARVDLLYPSSSFPAQDGGVASCGAPYALRLHVGVHRCVSVPDDRGNAPAPEVRTGEARMLLEDARKLRAAIMCAEWYTPKETVMGAWQPVGGGGCAGGFWTVTMRVRSPWPASG